MTENKQTYLEKRIQAHITKNDKDCTFQFQNEKINLDSQLEIEMLKSLNPLIMREIEQNEDEIIIRTEADPALSPFLSLKNYDERSKWLFAYQLVKARDEHHLTRLNLVICPENILIDQTFTPYFMHYGVKESLPPYERDKDIELKELKATVAQAIDWKHTYSEYLNHSETLPLSQEAKEIMQAENSNSLLKLIQTHLERLAKEDKYLVHIPQKKWKTLLYASLLLLLLLIPALIYTGKSMFFDIPKQQAFLAANEHYISKDYSGVKSVLAKYKVEDINSGVVKYELADSSIQSLKDLGREQRENIHQSIAPDTDTELLDYWINIGRGDGEKALEYANLHTEDIDKHYDAQLKADKSMSASDQKQKIDETEQRLAQLKKDKDEQNQKAAENSQQADEDAASAAVPPQNGGNAAAEKAPVPANSKPAPPNTKPADKQQRNAPQNQGGTNK
ncbi:type VII secretion protein EssB [Metabacillus sp. RGM 3146]|uniref:type VII secretion protein EssB n=1 Tax=Metabacillus sp. RGM 3146 TaxID=3401092 RepID=UPI003B99F2D4